MCLLHGASEGGGARLRLVPFADDHLDVLAAWFPDARSLVQWGGPGLAHPLRRSALAAALPPAPGAAFSALLPDGAVAGHAQLFVDPAQGVARLARVAVAPQLRGQGLAVPMLAGVIDHAFAMPQVERIELNVFAWNGAALRSYARLGFVHEGTRRSSVRVGTERWDTAVMGLLRAEWQPPTARPETAPPAAADRPASGPTVASTASAEHYLWGQACDGWLLAPGRDLLVIEERMPPGSFELRHRHAVARQFFYGLDGELTLEVEGRHFRLGPRTGLEVPPGMAHQARNVGTDDARFLVISTPSTRGDRIPADLPPPD